MVEGSPSTLAPTWETQIEVLAPGFSLIHTQLLWKRKKRGGEGGEGRKWSQREEGRDPADNNEINKSPYITSMKTKYLGCNSSRKKRWTWNICHHLPWGCHELKSKNHTCAEEPLEHSLNVKNMFFKKDCALKHFNTHNSWKYGFFLFFFRSNNCSSILIHFWFWDFLDTFKTEVKSDKVAVPLAKALWKY